MNQSKTGIARWALVAMAACGESSQAPDANGGVVDARPLPDAMARETVMLSKALVAGELAEAVLAGGPGDVARLRVTADNGVAFDWNIHGHANNMTQTLHEELGATAMDLLFAPPADADWYLLLRNSSGAPVTMVGTIELYGEMTFSGWL